MKKKEKRQFGFLLIEAVVSIGIFALLTASVLGIYSAMTRSIKVYREQTTISALADQYMESARNLSYSQIGTISGNPHGNLPDQPNPATVTSNGNTYNIYYEITYIDDPADGTALLGTDFAPNDYKQLKLTIRNTSTLAQSNFVTTIVPKGLENLSNGGALAIKVFNALGQPVQGATINITNTSIVPNINLTRTSDAGGNWIEVGLPDNNNSYHILVSKGSYSSDQTYPISQSNPNPTKPDATIANGQVTQVSFSIDLLSNLLLNTFNQTCAAIPDVGLELKGSKLIGTPNVLKFDKNYISNSNGQINLNNIEWDTYTPTLSSDTYMVYGSSPIQQVSILPNTSQTFTFILGPATSNSLLVIVKDASSNNPIEGASVELQKANPASDNTQQTGGSVFSQQDWTGGFGQNDFSDPTKYFQDDGNISTNEIPSGLRLLSQDSDQTYSSSGYLISSSFDSGTTATSYTTLTWQPTSEDPATNVQFQIATNNDDATWNFIGPDGTSNTYYSTSGNTISTANNSNRYLRYKVYLSTTDPTKTPVLTSVNINYVSGCFTPGQTIFPSLQSGSDYTATISMPGYQSQTVNNLNISGYNVLPILLSH